MRSAASRSFFESGRGMHRVEVKHDAHLHRLAGAGADGIRGQPVREQQVVHGADGGHRVLNARGVLAIKIPAHSGHPGFVMGDEGTHPVG